MAPAQPQQQPSLCIVMPEMRAGQGSQSFLSSHLKSPPVQRMHSTDWGCRVGASPHQVPLHAP